MCFQRRLVLVGLSLWELGATLVYDSRRGDGPISRWAI